MLNKCIALILLLPTLAWAVDFPGWHIKEDEACYGFEDAKKLKTAELECFALDKYFTETPPLVTKLKSTLVEQDLAIQDLTHSSEDLRGLVADLQTQRDTALQEAAAASAHSLLGDGWVWLAVATAVGLVAGATGVYLLK